MRPYLESRPKKKWHECKGKQFREEWPGTGRPKADGDGKWVSLKYFICMYENRIMKPIKTAKKGGVDKKE
jgi:hypothetical protein